MGLKPGYKQTQIGVIPSDWDALPAARLGYFRGGTGFPLAAQGEQSGEYPFFKVSDMNNDGNETYMVNANNWISESTRQRLGATAFPAGSIVFAKVGAAVFLERKKILSRPSCIDNNMAAFVLDEKKAQVAFMHSQLLGMKFGALVATTALPALSGKVLAEMPLAVPLLPEQSAIAAALGDMDALLSALDARIAKQRDLKVGVVKQLLTGKIRLPGFGGEWETKRLGDHVTFIKNGVYSRAELGTNDCVKYLHYGDVHTTTDVLLHPQSAVMPTLAGDKAARLGRLTGGDLVFVDATEDLAGVGKSVEIANIGNAHVVAGLHTIAARFDKSVLADGFKAYLQFIPTFGKHLRSLAAGTKVFATNRVHIASAEFELPSVEEQAAIAAVLADMDQQLAALEQQRAKTALLKQGMMQELLTGRARLV